MNHLRHSPKIWNSADSAFENHKMASLRSDNPHANGSVSAISPAHLGPMALGARAVQDRWKLALGDAVADDAKTLLAVRIHSHEYIMADIRHLIHPSSADEHHVYLEFFFDGDSSGFGAKGHSKADFLDALQSTVRIGVQEFYRRKLKQMIATGGSRSQYKDMQYPDDTIRYVGETLAASFRDAGCMLSFVAVRVSMSSECATAIGGIAFPEYFGSTADSSQTDRPVPRWLVGMAGTAAVMGVATIYAWSRILVYGNEYS